MRWIKGFVIFVLSFLFIFNNIFAVTLNTPTDVDILYVGVFHNSKWSGWKKEVDVYKGDKVWFHIHAYANGGKVVNLISKLEDINNKIYSPGRVKVTAFVDADNAEKIVGKVYLNFKDRVRMEYMSYKWAIKLKGVDSEENEHVKNLPYNQRGIDTMSSNGVRLGDLEEDYRSNLLVAFNASEIRTLHTKIPIDGLCSEQLNKCLKGTFKNVPDTSDQYVWNCLGLYGGKSVLCLKKKTPIDGVCSKRANQCIKGKFSDIPDNDTEVRWKCLGLYGGIEAVCSAKKWCLCEKVLEECQSGKNTDNNLFQTQDKNKDLMDIEKINLNDLKEENNRLKEQINRYVREIKKIKESKGCDSKINQFSDEDSDISFWVWFYWIFWIISVVASFFLGKKFLS